MAQSFSVDQEIIKYCAVGINDPVLLGRIIDDLSDNSRSYPLQFHDNICKSINGFKLYGEGYSPVILGWAFPDDFHENNIGILDAKIDFYTRLAKITDVNIGIEDITLSYGALRKECV